MLMRTRNSFFRAERGFTLIELLVTLVIVSVGLLGMAKLQAAAVAESQVSRVRSLMTFQAESLSGVMSANRSYWGATTGKAPGFTVAAGAGTATDTAGTMVAGGNCDQTTATPCSAAQIASFDVTAWAVNFGKQFPTGAASVICSTPAATVPTTCDIKLTWAEHYVAMNRATAGGTSSDTTLNMILHVQP
jgi:type IV pilus assembly protein PilV